MQQQGNTVKSNNKKKIYINELLRSPLLKHTHRKKIIQVIQKGSIERLLERKRTPTTPEMEDPRAKVNLQLLP